MVSTWLRTEEEMSFCSCPPGDDLELGAVVVALDDLLNSR